MGVLNSFTRSNTPSVGDVVHKHRQQRHSSCTKSSIASKDIPRLSVSDSNIELIENRALFASKDSNGENVDIPAGSAAAAAPAFDSNRHSSYGNQTTKKPTLPKRWIPKKKSGMFTSFKSNKNNHQHSSDYSASSSDALAENLQEIGHRFKENLDEDLEEAGREGRSSSCEPSQQPQPPHQPPAKSCRPQRQISTVSSASEDSLSDEFSYDENSTNDLDRFTNGNKDGRLPSDAESMLEKLGEFPSSSELANVAAVCANEYINECFFSDTAKQEGATAGLDLEKWESVPQYTKTDVIVQRHLGKGSFSDAFEVIVMVAVEEKRLNSGDEEDLDRRIEAKFATTTAEEKEDGPDVQFDATFAAVAPSPAPAETLDSPPANLQAQRRPSRAERESVDQGVCASSCVREAQVPPRTVKKTQMTYAMKCLRPQIRSNAEHFIMGVEDLVHESAMLASLDHPNIIKLHGRAVCDSFHLSDGYFILLDRLQDTLEDRIAGWRETNINGGKKMQPSLSQLEKACCLADALSYLHSKNIVFRDLKPANVGFDERGVLKLFDFGFAIGLKNDSDMLDDKCGTPRYMAPEIGLDHDYSIPVDVYSFGILLWEIMSLKKPFSNMKSPDEFRKLVFEKGERPKVSKRWAPCLKDVMKKCWCNEAAERPTMEVVNQILKAHLREMRSSASRRRNNNGGSWKKSFSMRRLTQ